jgi:hypothetical protein
MLRYSATSMRRAAVTASLAAVAFGASLAAASLAGPSPGERSRVQQSDGRQPQAPSPAPASAQAPAQAAAQASPTPEGRDLILGTWRLNLSKSTYAPGPPPRSEVRSYEEEHEGVRATITTTQADGSTTVVEYLASFNETSFPVVGAGDVDAVGLKAIDPYTSEVSLVTGGRVTGTARRVIARDLKSMTVTVSRMRPDGTANIVAVFDRVDQ